MGEWPNDPDGLELSMGEWSAGVVIRITSAELLGSEDALDHYAAQGAAQIRRELGKLPVHFEPNRLPV